MSKKQVGFYINSQRCIGCYSCAMACKNQYHQEPGVHWRYVYPLKEEVYPHRDRAWMSLACNHCENPTCLEVCPVGAYYKREKDGVVVHQQDKCIGCGNCVRSCPYGAPRFNPVLQKAEKCSLCYQRLDAGLKPACVQACPTHALQFIDDMDSFDQTGKVQFLAGFPRFPALNPSVRFRPPREPREVRR
jgi:DMSO reductase iron-sulfur subunit